MQDGLLMECLRAEIEAGNLGLLVGDPKEAEKTMSSMNKAQSKLLAHAQKQSRDAAMAAVGKKSSLLEEARAAGIEI